MDTDTEAAPLHQTIAPAIATNTSHNRVTALNAESRWPRTNRSKTDPDDDTMAAFIMNERLSYENVQANPNAAYLFVEEGDGYVGKRLTMKKAKEEDDQEKIKHLRRRNLPDECYEGKTQHLVHFHIDGVRPLIGTE
jgi:hypothetical protein